jgi:thiol peroxidase
MSKITFKGTPVETAGALPKPGSIAPDFNLTREDLSDVSLKNFEGKKKILNIVPSLDTGVCAASARRFDHEVAALKDTVLLTVSNDLPFAMSRFCKAEGLETIISLSQMRNRKFGTDWGVVMTNGPLAGILSRAVVVLDSRDTVVYTEQVAEIGHEPDYAAALEAVKACK